MYRVCRATVLKLHVPVAKVCTEYVMLLYLSYVYLSEAKMCTECVVLLHWNYMNLKQRCVQSVRCFFIEITCTWSKDVYRVRGATYWNYMYLKQRCVQSAWCYFNEISCAWSKDVYRVCDATLLKLRVPEAKMCTEYVVLLYFPPPFLYSWCIVSHPLTVYTLFP